METDRARQRAEVILQVRNGTITASEGAKRLGVSRKTYYEWERKGLSALMDALQDGAAGRPATVQEDPELPSLRNRIALLEKEVEAAKQTAEVRKVLELYEQQLQLSSVKKNRSREKQ
jgi:transposase-like protein